MEEVSTGSQEVEAAEMEEVAEVAVPRKRNMTPITVLERVSAGSIDPDTQVYVIVEAGGIKTVAEMKKFMVENDVESTYIPAKLSPPVTRKTKQVTTFE